MSRRTLNRKAIELCEAGLGKRKNKADALTEEDEETLWSSNRSLGRREPTSLNQLSLPYKEFSLCCKDTAKPCTAVAWPSSAFVSSCLYMASITTN